MMSLEVIVGSELVLPVETYKDALELVTDIQGLIPTTTYQLLREMLFDVRDEHVVHNAKGYNFETIYTIS